MRRAWLLGVAGGVMLAAPSLVDSRCARALPPVSNVAFPQVSEVRLDVDEQHSTVFPMSNVNGAALTAYPSSHDLGKRR